MTKFYSFFFGTLTFTLLFSGISAVTLTIKNNCPNKIWPAILTSGATQLSNTGFELGTGSTSSVNVPSRWTGRVWARTRCSSSAGRFTCGTADCGSGQVGCNGAGGAPPASLAEFTLVANGQDFYDVSLVDGFNLPVSITPQGGSGNTCKTTSCRANVNAVCPSELTQKGADGAKIGCKSACVAFNQPRYCCTGQFNKPETCPPTNYSRIFKNQCPQAYSYAYDDHSSTFSCTGAPNYLITFCP